MNTTSEEQQLITELYAKSAFKSLLSLIPYAGRMLADSLFEYRGILKQNRLNRFVQLLKNEFAASGGTFNIDNIKSEEFSDLFEKVLINVSKNRNDKKLEAFKNILLKGMEAQENIDYCEIFNDLLAQIHETQIEILKQYRELTGEYEKGILAERSRLKFELQSIQLEISSKEKDMKDEMHEAMKDQQYYLEDEVEKIDRRTDKIRHLTNYRDETRKPLSEHQYYIQDLFTKGLINDEGVGSIGTRAFEIMSITNLGLKFLDFIERN